MNQIVTSKSDYWDVVIVGAGPVGLALAKGLAQDNRRVLIIEKKEGLSQHSKAATVWPPTQEVLERLGLLDTFVKNSITYEDVHICDADDPKDRYLLHVPLYELKNDTKFPRLLVIPQNETERLLYESLAEESGVTVLFDANVKTLSDTGDNVEITYERLGETRVVTGRFVVGCDGAKSAVRQSLGFKLQGETYPFKAGLSDVYVEAARTYESPRLSNKNSPYVGIRIGENFWRLILLVRREKSLDLERATADAVKCLFGDVKYRLEWTSEFNLHRRTSEKFGIGNVVLAGDAAHLNSPVGGQGMNAGIQDTEALRGAFRTAFRIDNSRPLLDYAKERKDEIEKGVNHNTGQLTSVAFAAQGRFLRAFLKVVRTAMLIPVVRHMFLKKIAMIQSHDVNEAYINSSLFGRKNSGHQIVKPL